MNDPIEGALYRGPFGDLFRVLFVGVYRGAPGFITKMNEFSLKGWKLKDWQSPFFQPSELLATVVPKTSEDPYGKHSCPPFWGKAVKYPSGEIAIKNAKDYNEDEVTELCLALLEKVAKKKH